MERRFASVRENRPAQNNSASDNATWPPMIRRDSRWRRPGPFVSPWIDASGSTRIARHAASAPNSTAVTSVSPTANRNARDPA